MDQAQIRDHLQRITSQQNRSPTTSNTKIVPVTVTSNPDELEAERQQRALQYDHDHHEAILQRKQTMRRSRSQRRTSQRLDAKRYLKSSSLLRQLGAFQHLPAKTFHACVDAFVSLEYEDGATILLQGKEATQFMVLARGSCRVLQEHSDGSDRMLQRPLRTMHAPCFFGESALLSPDDDGRWPRRTASVVAVSPPSGLSVTVLSLTRCAFDKLVNDGVLSSSEVSTGLRKAAEKSYRRSPLKRMDTVRLTGIEDAPIRQCKLSSSAVAKGGEDKNDEANDEVTAQTTMYDRYEREFAERSKIKQERAKASLGSRLPARSVLKKTQLFANWAIADVNAVVRCMRSRNFAQGTRICSEGDQHAEEFFIIIRGAVSVTQRNGKGKEVELQVLREFDSFGLAALTCGVEGAKRTASCSAVSHVETLVLYRDDFQQELDKVEARNRTAKTVGIGNGGGGGRRHGSVQDALVAAADANMKVHRAKDSTRRLAARKAVAKGAAPAPPPRPGDGEFSAGFVVDDGDNSDEDASFLSLI